MTTPQVRRIEAWFYHRRYGRGKTVIYAPRSFAASDIASHLLSAFAGEVGPTIWAEVRKTLVCQGVTIR